MNKNLTLSLGTIQLQLTKHTIMLGAVVLFISLFNIEAIQAQDKHFTQFYAAPLTLNPALTGSMPGRYRVSGIYRDQWRGVLDNPYTTFGAAIDVNFDIELDSRYKDQVAIGLLFVNDKVPEVDFSTTQISLSAAFHKGLDFDKKQFLTLGIQGTMAQRNVNYENLTFDDQFNDLDAFEFATSEDLPENNFGYGDFNVGLNYLYSLKTGVAFNAGISMHHVFSPELSFYAAESEDDPDAEFTSNKLYSKYSAQLSLQFPIAKGLFLMPRVLYAKQGPHTEINAGTNLRIKLNSFNNNALHIGCWVRPVSNEDNSTSVDAIVGLLGLELGGVSFGLSYDANLNSLSTYKQGQGSIEFSLTYIGSFDNEDILCPKF